MFSERYITKTFFLLTILSAILLAWWLNIPSKREEQVSRQSQGSIEDPRIKIGKDAAVKISQLDGIKQASVLIMQNIAYVAVVVESNGGLLTNDMENKIIKQINSTYLTIRRVNISANPDFVKCINTYITNVDRGKTNDGFYEQFNTIIDQNFPRYRD